MPAFVLEIGTEELPARFLAPAEKELHDKFSAALAEKGLAFSGLRVMSSPRRLVAVIEDLAATAELREETVLGPSVKAAYDVGNRPTRAAEGFAKTHGVSLENTFTVTNAKGEYLAVKKTIGGEAALPLLQNLCPAIIGGLSFPKRMKWGSGEFTFARPLRWILALLDAELIPFAVGGLISANLTHGHRVHGPGPFSVPSASDYVRIVAEECRVILPAEERRAIIIAEGTRIAAEKNGKVIWNEALLDEVQGLSEFPVPMLGSFERSFLEVPREVLLTSMQSHQKSFGVEDEEGNLLPHFLTVSNIVPQEAPVVRKGWERVLRARLEDARFFWKSDLEIELAAWLDSLDTVIYLAQLGSMGDKTRRIAELAGWLAGNVRFLEPGTAVRVDDAIRAGRICKADLVSEMVKEFDTLQGIMGGIYARRKGETDIVAQAVAEQYLPAGPDSPVPVSYTGALLSMADKMDTLVGCFGLGLIPTGATDPYALRRAALGIARILLEKGIRLNMRAFFQKAQEVYGTREWKLEPEQALLRMEEFFALRLKNLFLTEEGRETLFVEAVLSADASDPWGARARLDALEAFSKTEAFAPTAQAFKRVANIIRKQTEETPELLSGCYEATLLTEPQELALAAELERLTPLMTEKQNRDEYAALFDLLAELRPAVDAFFEGVMVMSEDPATRQNRLKLLKTLQKQFDSLADFSALQL